MPHEYDIPWTCRKCKKPIYGAVRMIEEGDCVHIYHAECAEGAEGIDDE